MTHENPAGNNVHEDWRPAALKTLIADLRRNPTFGFVRLACLSEMSLPLQDAYHIRLQPDAQHSLPDLEERLRHLPPADLGRFKALNYANSIHDIFSKAFADEPGLAILAPNTPAYQRGPEIERCDLEGNRHRLICEPGAEYELAVAYTKKLDALIPQLARGRFTGDEESMAAYQEGWQSAGHELVSRHQAYVEELRARGPVFVA